MTNIALFCCHHQNNIMLSPVHHIEPNQNITPLITLGYGREKFKTNDKELRSDNTGPQQEKEET